MRDSVAYSVGDASARLAADTGVTHTHRNTAESHTSD